MEVKFEIKLEAKEPINGYKVGDTVIIVNTIFDKNNGIAFFPIDKNFDIVYTRQFMGVYASGKEVFDGDILSDGKEKYMVWIEGGKMLMGGLIKEWDRYINPLIVSKMEIIGNRFTDKI